MLSEIFHPFVKPFFNIASWLNSLDILNASLVKWHFIINAFSINEKKKIFLVDAIPSEKMAIESVDRKIKTKNIKYF